MRMELSGEDVMYMAVLVSALADRIDRNNPAAVAFLPVLEKIDQLEYDKDYSFSGTVVVVGG